MAYRYVNQNQVKEQAMWCVDIIHKVQKELREYFTFDFRLIGSGDRRLVTQNGNEPFDLDYNIILQRDKQDLLDNPQKIKDLFRKAFEKILKKEVKGYTSRAGDSTSVVTAKILDDNNIAFSFDVAILVERKGGYYDRIINDKKTGLYIWNKIKDSNNYLDVFQKVKTNGYWIQFKKRYLDLKNMHLKRQDEVKSFSVFLETLNEFRNKV